MLLDSKPYTLDRIVRMVLRLVILAVLIGVLHFFREVLLPFAAAFLLAYLINPLVTAIQHKVRRRSVAVVAALLVVLSAIILLFLFLVPLILSEFSAMIPFLEKAAQAKPPEWLVKLLPNVQWDHLLQQISNQDVQEWFQSERFQSLLRKVLPGVWNVITGAVSFIIGLIGLAIVLLYMIFLLIDYDKIKESWPSYLPPGSRSPVVGFVQDFNSAMKRYFRGQAIIASLVGCLFAFGFWMIGLPLGIFLGLFIGLLNMVPYLQIVGLIPAFLLAFLSGIITGANLWQLPLLTLLVFGCVQSLQDLVLTPKILGKATGLSPAVILLSLAIWGKLLGMLGLLIAIPMTCLVLAYYQRFIAPPSVSEQQQTDQG